jgi:hypothetical protein
MSSIENVTFISKVRSGENKQVRFKIVSVLISTVILKQCESSNGDNW